jgi:hypothetical protein
MDSRTGGAFKRLDALAAFLLGQPAKRRLNVKARIWATDYDEVIHALSCHADTSIPNKSQLIGEPRVPESRTQIRPLRNSI